MAVGHMIRDGKAHAAGNGRRDSNNLEPEPEQTRVTIIGGGIAGLSAGWWLKKNGFNDFTILELEKNVGGNSSFGKNAISSYPWGAHYVPLANPESEYVRMFFQELGIIQGFDSKSGLAIYNDLYMCHDPEERLLKDGTFQEGLVPRRGLQPSDKEELNRFFAAMTKFREMVGKDGKPAFAIPVDLSSLDPEFTALDKISMFEWMQKNKFLGKPINWYVDYCCRDDYGAVPAHISAWAGIHYFAGRKGVAANADMNSVVTWPAGNGFLVEKLREQLSPRIRIESAVISIANTAEGADVTYMDVATKSVSVLKSDYVICSAPRFFAKHLIHSGQKIDMTSDVQYSPWMVANISLNRIPEGKGVGLAWDNVSFSSKSLGYVVATHQNITTQRNAPTVVTYYYPLAYHEPSEARQRLLKLSPDQWADEIIADLEKMHNGISREITSIDLWPWGHGMIRPSVGFIWGESRRAMKENLGNIYFAHSDMSGISNFEEAQYHGVEAAKHVLARVT
jgi:protoporphyrinogen oxidase